ncbi:DUF6902 family protein [Roseobacteraceae bacterium S113]
MSNIIKVPFSTPQERKGIAYERLLRGFATQRRAPTDVMWLKENGELLNILVSTGADVAPRFLEVHRSTYLDSPERLSFFPQYYRFLLSMTLDLEDLGLDGVQTHNLGEQLCDWVVAQDLPGGETSDIQRLEAKRLLARRNRTPIGDDADLEARLRAFISVPERFALPNKKAAYELTHIVFYLSNYGETCPNVGPSACRSLENVGIWAFLDGNADLLAEICIAMRYAGCNPSEIWEDWIAQQMINHEVYTGPALTRQDEYHAVFMCGWSRALCGEAGLGAIALPAESGDVPMMSLPPIQRGALGELSRRLHAMGPARSADWHGMRDGLAGAVSDAAQDRIIQAERSSPAFADFFESFARTSRIGRA